ncbi:MAG: fasciclin domain-containing protein [Elainellaceae cyanobacterium]
MNPNRVLTTVGIAGLTLMSSIIALSSAALAQERSAQYQQAVRTTQTSAKSPDQTATIAALASSSEAFETLTAALEAADLVDILDGDENYTVFAPTDEAFAALPDGTLEALLQPENRDQLVQILTYHVVPGRVLSTDLSAGAVASAEGSALNVAIDNSGISINDANVIQPDVEASNGVIHVIDRVLLLPDQ